MLYPYIPNTTRMTYPFPSIPCTGQEVSEDNPVSTTQHTGGCSVRQTEREIENQDGISERKKEREKENPQEREGENARWNLRGVRK